MKIAVVTISLNEKKFVKPWYESAKDADYLLIADTGSTDGMIEEAKKYGINVVSISIKPWRFDDARNAALALIPDDMDFVIHLDMDEVLVKGWRKHLEAVKPETTRPRYQYTWNWKDEAETMPSLQYGGDKIVRRHGYRWKHPVHEVMVADRITEVQEWIDLEIHHHPDNTKSRSSYFPLLQQSVIEDPHDDRNAFYFARELFFYNQHKQSADEFKRHLSLPRAVWAPERAASMRYLAKLEPENRVSWLTQAVAQAPGRREPLVELAQHYYALSDWENCYKYAKEAVEIKEKPLDYLCEDFAWSDLPWDLLALSAYHLGKKLEAVEYGKKALKYAPDNERLAQNLAFYTRK